MAEEPVWIMGSDGKWRNASGATLGAGTLPPAELPPLFPGHIANRVLVGMNAADDTGNPTGPPRPQYTEQATLIPGGTGYVRRVFSSNWYSTSKLNEMIGVCEARNQLPVLSFKVNNDWDGVANGDYDADLATWRAQAIAKRTANGGNGKPYLASIHHEPNSDGPAGLTLLEQLTWWGKMQLHCVNYFSGWRTGTYNPAEDVSDIIVWAPIANGFWWGTKAYYPDRIAAALPPELIAALNRSGGPVLADMYDPPPNSWTYDTAGNRMESSFAFNSNYDRCWRLIEKMVAWARANQVKSIGFGEFGNVTLANWDLTIEQIMDNRDIISIALMYNNFQNSRWDWRALPADYPAYNGTNSRGLVDTGGDTLSAAYIDKFVTLRDRSVAETSPL